MIQHPRGMDQAQRAHVGPPALLPKNEAMSCRGRAPGMGPHTSLSPGRTVVDLAEERHAHQPRSPPRKAGSARPRPPSAAPRPSGHHLGRERGTHPPRQVSCAPRPRSAPTPSAAAPRQRLRSGRPKSGPNGGRAGASDRTQNTPRANTASPSVRGRGGAVRTAVGFQHGRGPPGSCICLYPAVCNPEHDGTRHATRQRTDRTPRRATNAYTRLLTEIRHGRPLARRPP